MASASIRSSIPLKPTLTGVSREDLALGDVVTVTSPNVGTAYSWSLAYTPEGSTAAFSGSTVAQSPGTFTVDVEGAYLVRLQFTDGSGTTEQFVRLRAITTFAGLKLVAAGEQVGPIPVPVDITPAGWADNLNGNLLSLLTYLRTVSSSGRVLYVDPERGDYQTIQAAIDYAQTQGPTTGTPWIVLVRPGLYTEQLTFRSFVHVFGWPGKESGSQIGVAKIRNPGTASHVANLAGGGDELSLSGLSFEQTNTTTNPLLSLTGSGKLFILKCRLEVGGSHATQGPAIRVGPGSQLDSADSRFKGSSTSGAGAYTFEAQSQAQVELIRCRISDRGVLSTGASIAFLDSRIDSDGTFALRSFGSLFDCRYSKISGDLTFNPGATVLTIDVIGRFAWSIVDGETTYDTTNISGNTELSFSATPHGSVTYPGAPPASVAPLVPADSIGYDDTLTGLGVDNVQDALDALFDRIADLGTLTDAYNGGDSGPTGSGRTIVANAGAVQIVDADSPSDPIPAANTNGCLQIVGGIYIGAIDKPEISLDPNPYGGGPEILLGREIRPNDAALGPTVYILGNATGNPTYHNYNLLVGSKPANGGGHVGHVSLRGGDSLNAGVVAGNVIVQAGRAVVGGSDGGTVILVPGDGGGAADGVVIVRPESATGAQITAAGAFVGGVSGTIRFGSTFGALVVDIDAADNLATVLNKINGASLGHVTAVDSGGGVIRITTTSTGQMAQIYFLNATPGLDAALGGFAGQVMTQGAWPAFFVLKVTAHEQLVFGAGSANPMTYNSNTGKLTVPGIIDPTALVLDFAAAPPTGASEGGLFVSDGSGGLVAGGLYFRPASNGAPMGLSGGAPFTFPSSVNPTQVGEGEAVWDSDDDLLTVGTGAGRKTMADTNSTQTLSNKSLVSPILLVDDGVTNAVTDVVSLLHTTSGLAAPGIGTGLLFRAENAAGASVDVARISGFLENVGAGTEVSDLGFYTRTGGGALTLRWVIDGDGDFTPVVDNAVDVGESTHRVKDLYGIAFKAINIAGDANPTYEVSGTGIRGGLGGVNPLDVTLTRPAGGAFWAMSSALRLGGSLNRFESSFNIVTIRSNPGGGTDTITVQPAAGVAAAGSAQPGSALNLQGSAAAALGPGNFSAAGGQVFIQAGPSAAVNVAQINGTNVTIQGGAAASGAGGGAAKGGGVTLQGVTGITGGDGGDIAIQPGPLNGGGKDGSVIFSINGAARSPSLVPGGDNQGGIGTNSLRWATLNAVTFNSYNAPGDTNPIYVMGTAGFSGGLGGGSAPDVGLTRIAGPLWNMSVGLRVGGNITRNEAALTIGTTRTAAGPGDNVTIQPAAAVAAASSAQVGGTLNLFGSNAAATGGGNFSATGGPVIIQAGNSAAVNVAQANGVNVTVQGGAAASGAGGGAAKGGGVGLLGVAGVAGGDGGDINISPGPLNGGGKDGSVLFQINGASRSPDLIPRATNEGNLGTTNVRWAGIAYRDENSSGKKVLGFITKVFGDSPYTVGANDYIILYDPTGGNSTVNLPAAATNAGREVRIKHNSASGNTVTIDANGGELIDGALTLVLNSRQAVTLLCDGTGWVIM